MAPHAQHNAHHFAKSSEHPADYNKEDYHSSTHDFSRSLDSAASSVQQPLHVHVERVVRQYFAMLGDEMPTDLYELILKQVEEPLLSVVLEKTRGNQNQVCANIGAESGYFTQKTQNLRLNVALLYELTHRR